MNFKQALLLSCLTAPIIFACSTKEQEMPQLTYPESKKIETTDTYFGETVADPYRWLENDTSQATAQWVEAQNDVTFGYLNQIPYRAEIKKRIEAMYNYERLGAPFREGDYLYFYKNDGLQNHSVLYRKKGEDGSEELFLDPNTFSKDATTVMRSISFTRDGSLATFLLSEGGSDWNKAVTIRTADKQIVEDTLQHIKFSGISWRGNEGFYYSSYDKPTGSHLSSKTQHHKLFFHRLGTKQSEDELVFGGEQTPRRYIFGGVTEDERYLVVSAQVSTTGNELYIQDLTQKGSRLVPIVNNFDNTHRLIDNDGSRLIIETNLDAPNGKIVQVDASNPSMENWRDMIPETETSIENVSTAGKKIFINYLKDAATLVKQFDYTGKAERDIQLPGLGTANGFNGKRDEKEVYYSYTSFTYPTSIFKYDLGTGESVLHEQPDVDFNPEDYETHQVFFTSKDGTKIPMFIVHKKGLERNGKNPTILYGYGGFNISLTPGFSPSRIVWLENGGIYAQPNLRGGGEYGKKWHLAGTKTNKQNVFDDFIAAGEYLISEKYTDNNYLAIAGGSNGGLLVGATMTQRPDLAKVAFPDVGVLDMLRYHTFTAGAGWAYDYGTAEESKEMFEYLRKYSPVHALKPGVEYPATLVTTADHDDRVVPAHSFKFAATLQEHHKGTNPVLIRIDVKSGHGASNLSKAMDKMADQYAFAWYNMNIIPPLAKKDM